MRHSQKYLMVEGFSDFVHGAAMAMKAVVPELTDPAERLINRGKEVGKGIARMTLTPTTFVKRTLKQEYYRTFNISTINIIETKKLPNDPKGGNRTLVRFGAERYNAPSPTQPAASAETLVPPPEITTEAISGGASPLEVFYAVVTKGPSGYEMQVFDKQGRVIKGEKEKEITSKPNWDKVYASSGIGARPTAVILGGWIDTDIKYLPKDRIRALAVSNDLVTKDEAKNLNSTVSLIAVITGVGNVKQPLSAADVSKVKTFLKDNRIVENTQLDVLKNIKVLSSSCQSMGTFISS